MSLKRKHLAEGSCCWLTTIDRIQQQCDFLWTFLILESRHCRPTLHPLLSRWTLGSLRFLSGVTVTMSPGTPMKIACLQKLVLIQEVPQGRSGCLWPGSPTLRVGSLPHKPGARLRRGPSEIALHMSLY